MLLLILQGRWFLIRTGLLWIPWHYKNSLVDTGSGWCCLMCKNILGHTLSTGWRFSDQPCWNRSHLGKTHTDCCQDRTFQQGRWNRRCLRSRCRSLGSHTSKYQYLLDYLSLPKDLYCYPEFQVTHSLLSAWFYQMDMIHCRSYL